METKVQIDPEVRRIDERQHITRQAIAQLTKIYYEDSARRADLTRQPITATQLTLGIEAASAVTVLEQASEILYATAG